VYVYIRGYRHRLMGGGVEAADIDDLIARRPELGSRYNVRPTQDVVVIVNEDGRPVARPMRWGLIPSWSKAEKLPRNTFNARDDRLVSSGMWRGPFKRSRGVVPATGFFEWKKADGTKQPMYITPKDGQGFMFAAVYDSWINEHGETVESEYVPTRPFRVNAGSVHSYILMSDGSTKYLSELNSGDEVAVVSEDGICDHYILVFRSPLPTWRLPCACYQRLHSIHNAKRCSVTEILLNHIC